MNIIAATRLSLVTIILSLLACYTPPKTPSRLPSRSSIPAQAKSYDLRIITIVSREHPHTVDSISVTATTGGNRISDNTGQNGAVSLTLPYSPGDPIDFEFKKDSNYWVARSSNIPVGAQTIKVYFQLDEGGVVSFSRIEY